MALFFTDYSLGLVGLRDGPWKLIHSIESGRSSLFFLPNDAQERRDLSEFHAARAAWYRDHLLRWTATQRAKFVGIAE